MRDHTTSKQIIPKFNNLQDFHNFKKQVDAQFITARFGLAFRLLRDSGMPTKEIAKKFNLKSKGLVEMLISRYGGADEN